MTPNDQLPHPGVETAKELGLLAEEYEQICDILGREPNFTELSIFSVMWSEHCSYKNSIRWLKTLPRSGAKMLVEAGEENAGLIDIGDGLACAFKIESHNHPSAIEPYQGAATGVGGIHRDIFTMGARPIAALNSLRFGNPLKAHTRHLVRGVVKGIGDYGNCFGVPTVGGEVYFEDCYQTNPLVNAMSVGILETGKMVSAIALGEGNPVYIVGSATGKDGIHGASFASADLHEESHEDLPSVQVGDPFQEKLLLEASLEAIATGAVVGMQDMGAAGITCSTSEMSAKGEHGMIIHLDRVPTRQENMKSWEILLSESQERMLVVVEKGREKEIEAVFEKWDLHAVVIGEVTTGGTLQYFMHDQLMAEVPAHSLVLGGGAPVYEREYREAAYYKKLQSVNLDELPVPDDLPAIAKQIAARPNIASKRWIYTQYDSMVGIRNTSTNKASDAAVVRITGTKKGLAVTVDCNGKYVYADPFKGTMMAVSEAARNIVCSGGEPAAITNCLNFGNPYNPEVYWQFVQAIKGMGEACKAFDTPVTGGNVSFYNQSGTEAVYPTPTIGMVGVVEDMSRSTGLGFTKEDDVILLLGNTTADMHSSEYIKAIHGIAVSAAPHFELQEEVNLQHAVRELIRKKLVHSAHDISEGGLFITLLEKAMAGGMGFSVETDSSIRKDAFLFGEGQSRVVLTCKASSVEDIEEICIIHGVRINSLGSVGGDRLEIDGADFGSLDDYRMMYDNAIGNLMQSESELVS
ncbi:MAG: phosphoribosylformylglycinamidine synthase subunit PurL [Chitinophagales bacterium]|nr:phosphoribosylformylglycinamidine synthase subunit PurL [Chitinophagales bacterium]MCB9019487.1 phosphoribosylformylglycinamidine synthase subunit PurL [Chitinophagales bacterium]HPE97732.1 phosphoribosylformylglycinamidine synthase subunit PurL [Chitinophagales bacterium]HPR29049.1 phosphoribosylformylglycinamidine synthase subunit PurL [Chitinophagales bacterium]HQU40553.1 phosphoribosylformylglycinamidine synthase subunit PurL [Chitinophagales bacterium]